MDGIFTRATPLSIPNFKFPLGSNEGRTAPQVRKSFILQYFTRLHESLEFVDGKNSNHQRKQVIPRFRPGNDDQISVRVMGRLDVDAFAVGHGSVAVVVSGFLRSRADREVRVDIEQFTKGEFTGDSLKMEFKSGTIVHPRFEIWTISAVAALFALLCDAFAHRLFFA